MKHLLPLLVFALAACEGPSTYIATSATGNSVTEKRWGQIGGTRSTRRADGSSEVNDYQKSLRDLVAAAGAAAARIATVQSDNNLTATQGAQALAKDANARQPTVVQPIITPEGKVVFPQIVPPPPAVIPK